MTRIQRLGIVNRGEAALRCLRTVKALRAREGRDLRCIALYTPSDRHAPFVRHADVSVELPVRAGEVAAYLDHDLVLAALAGAGVDAVWPGWGFLAEDPAFADRVAACGIRFLGPSGATMRELGDKISAKRLAERVGVPIAPWSGAAVASADEAAHHAARIGYPLVVKAAAGGGGRGMRIVRAAEALPDALAAAAAEARAAFGDGRLFLEQLVHGGRHVEVQIVGDAHGHVVALGCRDCSVQRRHQKVIEEAPPPNLAPEVLGELTDAAVRLAHAVRYAGAGTVEFLVAPDGIRFLEVNPRLQVEHGVTEAVTGLDIVELQIRVAEGESLGGLVVRQSGAAIEARLCAEDPDADFAPAPGRIARFDAALGPGVRVDSGVVAGSSVPAAFDSLIAKVIATGATREEARTRLVCALGDLDLVIEGGATNKGFLIDVLASSEFRDARIDTGWLDRRHASEAASRPLGDEALVAAAIVAYQRARHAARVNFFADTTHASPMRAPASAGAPVDLSCAGTILQLHVFAIGSWRYRVHQGERCVTATWHEQDPHVARLSIGDRTRRIVYDADDAGVRLELDGRPHRFGWRNAGQVCAGTPAMVVAVDVAPGDRVEAGQVLGVLEAMKTEIPVRATVSGRAIEVRVRPGQQVAAGDVLVVIEPEAGADAAAADGRRWAIPDERDAVTALLEARASGAGAAATPEYVAAAFTALREEIRQILLGYDASAERCQSIVSLLEGSSLAGAQGALAHGLGELRHELAAFADVEEMFLRAPHPGFGEEPGPSSNARLRTYLRRFRTSGAGISELFLERLRATLAHYGIAGLAPCDPLERALLRLFASQRNAPLRHRLVLAVLRCLLAAARTAPALSSDAALASALVRIEALRALVGDAVADGAIEARYALFDRPRLEARMEEDFRQIEPWLATMASEPLVPPRSVLRHLADAPRPIFDRVGSWLTDSDPRRRSVALAAHLHRLYAPSDGCTDTAFWSGRGWVHRLERADGRVVLGAACEPCDVRTAVASLVEVAGRQAQVDPARALALELLVVAKSAEEDAAGLEALDAFRAPTAIERVTITVVREGREEVHRSFVSQPDGGITELALQGLHPEVAARLEFARLCDFELERLPGADRVHCFFGRSKDVAMDERILVLAEVRRSPEEGRDASIHAPSFEHAFYEAVRVLRSALALRDPKRRLQWNRIALFVAPSVVLDPGLTQELARRLVPATRHLGLECVVVRLRRIDADDPALSVREIELVASDLPNSALDIAMREPQREALRAVTDYERKVVDARRRRVFYPYEIVRMLTEGGRDAGRSGLPRGRFEEYDLDPCTMRAVRAIGRPWGGNECGVVIGVLSTPTEKVPGGMRRVLVLSDPTTSMGSLAAAECDRIVAAIDLAEELSLPVEWVPVSSGARISMDSGTENLDATARVVRRIVEFTGRGGVIHVIVHGVNVGAQSYWNALATMGMHTRGALVMTPGGSMVLTGRAALEASGSVAGEDEGAIGGFERIMGPNGEAQYLATDLADAYRILYEHYGFTYVVPGERLPRRRATSDSASRLLVEESVTEIFDPATNPVRKRPFAMRTLMGALVDRDGGSLERWRRWSGAETAIVWDAHLGGQPITLIGIESQNVPREGYRPLDGPSEWNGGTLFPLSSKKVARALRAASGNRPAVVLANLAGFDGSPESMRKLQLEYGAEIARAVVEFDGPILFAVVARYHGGAYVVFSKSLQPRLHAVALTGAQASVIGGAAAARVVFTREVRARADADPRLAALRRTSPRASDEIESAALEAMLRAQSDVAQEFDAIHTVERALAVGSIDAIVEPMRLRAYAIEWLERTRAPGTESHGA